MVNMGELNHRAEMCNNYGYENNLVSIDSYEINCMGCKNWNGQKCVISGTTYPRVTSDLEN